MCFLWDRVCWWRVSVLFWISARFVYYEASPAVCGINLWQGWPLILLWSNTRCDVFPHLKTQNNLISWYLWKRMRQLWRKGVSPPQWQLFYRWSAAASSRLLTSQIVISDILSTKGLLGFFLNAVTIVAFLKVRELRTPSNFLVFSLAMADIGISMNATVAAFSSFLRWVM